jgi:hypothetical protein
MYSRAAKACNNLSSFNHLSPLNVKRRKKQGTVGHHTSTARLEMFNNKFTSIPMELELHTHQTPTV